MLRSRWWTMDCSLPALELCRERALPGGHRELIFPGGAVRAFGDAATARVFLGEEEYVCLDDLVDAPPAPTVCGSCGTDWSDGWFGEACAECGGGALSRPCPHCDGGCHTVWVRMAMDSRDSGEAHWAGRCRGTG